MTIGTTYLSAVNTINPGSANIVTNWIVQNMHIIAESFNKLLPLLQPSPELKNSWN